MRDTRSPDAAAAGRDLLAAVDQAYTDGLLTAELYAGARRLCEDVSAGHVPAEDGRDEVRALISGMALRKRGIGTEYCRIADVLARELTEAANVRWSGVTVPGVEDRSSARTGLIEMPFPAVDFWAIAAIAHEVGHVLAYAPKFGHVAGNPARWVIDADQPTGQREELFCDFYATYVLGPAFPAFMITRFLDPDGATPERPFPDPKRLADTHPTPDKRVFIMLETLEKCTSWASERGSLEAAWRARLATDAGTDFDRDTRELLESFVGQLCHQVGTEAGNAFKTRMPARSLHRELVREGALPDAGKLSVLDVITAAWRARIKAPASDPAAVRHIAERALRLLRRIVPADSREGASGVR